MLKKLLYLAMLFKVSICLADYGNINIWATVHNNSKEPIWVSGEKLSKYLIEPGQVSPQLWITGHHYDTFYTEVHLWKYAEGSTRFCNNKYVLNDDFVYQLEHHSERIFEWNTFDQEGFTYFPTNDPYLGGHNNYFTSEIEFDGRLVCNFTTDDNARIVGGDNINVYSSIEVTGQ